MTVYSLEVDGRPELLVDVADPEPWVDALGRVEGALSGRRVHIEAVARPGLTVDCNPQVWFNAQNADR